jgi:hypothetical protein
MREHLPVSIEQLEEERDRLGRRLEQLQEGVVAVDHDLIVQFTTRALTAYLGSFQVSASRCRIRGCVLPATP